MKEKKKKSSLSIFEIVLAIILVPVLFYCVLKSLACELFWKVLWNPLFSLFPENISLIFVFILGFDLIWILGAFYIPKYFRFRIYSTLFIITSSLAILVFWVVMTGFGKAMH
jgi:hypothetical protein